MFEKLKRLFQRNTAETRKIAPSPIGSRVLVQPPGRPRNVSQSTTTPATTPTDDAGAFATSFAVGMATNNAPLAAIVGGSFAGGILGDIARDGAIGEVPSSPISCDTSTSSSDWSDGGSSSSSCGGD
jgi:hypothetical protein